MLGVEEEPCCSAPRVRSLGSYFGVAMTCVGMALFTEEWWEQEEDEQLITSEPDSLETLRWQSIGLIVAGISLWRCCDTRQKERPNSDRFETPTRDDMVTGLGSVAAGYGCGQGSVELISGNFVLGSVLCGAGLLHVVPFRHLNVSQKMSRRPVVVLDFGDVLVMLKQRHKYHLLKPEQSIVTMGVNRHSLELLGEQFFRHQVVNSVTILASGECDRYDAVSIAVLARYNSEDLDATEYSDGF